MIRVKLFVLLNTKDAIKELGEQKLPAKTAYWLTKFIRQVNQHLQDYDKVRVDLIKKYGKEVKPDYWEVTEKDKDLFIKDLNELLSIEHEFTEIEPISISALGNNEISAKTLLDLDYLIVE